MPVSIFAARLDARISTDLHSMLKRVAAIGAPGTLGGDDDDIRAKADIASIEGTWRFERL